MVNFPNVSKYKPKNGAQNNKSDKIHYNIILTFFMVHYLYIFLTVLRLRMSHKHGSPFICKCIQKTGWVGSCLKFF